MKSRLALLTGILLILSASLGLLLSLAGLSATLRFAPRVADTLQQQVSLAEEVIETTAQGLEAASQTLDATRFTLQTLDQTVLTLSQAITDTMPLLDTMETVVGEDLPATVLSTQASLDSAQQSARVIEGILRTLTAIPFFPGDPYRPEVPLSVALGNVSRSMNDLPQSFRTMQDSLQRSSANLATVQIEIQNMQRKVAEVESSLQQAQIVLSQYQQTAQTLYHQLVSLRLALPEITRWATLFLALFWIWLATAQIGLMTQGLDLIRRRPTEPGS
ncbi:MAG: hypothetical protein RML93_02635 [Anaerolineales bacterium]|nr:hypothetical protein [Anaerolineales bacterium]MDW8446170.1 hypothetical protein [Anaerolineales bacterium]